MPKEKPKERTVSTSISLEQTKLDWYVSLAPEYGCSSRNNLIYTVLTNWLVKQLKKRGVSI